MTKLQFVLCRAVCKVVFSEKAIKPSKFKRYFYSKHLQHEWVLNIFLRCKVRLKRLKFNFQDYFEQQTKALVESFIKLR